MTIPHDGFPLTFDGETFTEAEFTANEGMAYAIRLPQMLNAAAADFAAKQAAAALSGAEGTATSTTSLTFGPGSQELTVQAGKGYAPGMWIILASAADATKRMAGVCTGYDAGTGALTVFVEVVNGTGTINDWVVTVSIPVSGLGRQTAYLPATGLQKRQTNGPAAGSIELATNKIMVATLDFDAATIEYAQFQLGMPKGWDLATLYFRFIFNHGNTATNFGVTWAVRALATGNGDALDAAFGAAVTVNKVGGAADTQYTTAETPALTVAGSPAQHDVVRFEVHRLISDAGDTLAVDARLEGILVYYTVNTLSDA